MNGEASKIEMSIVNPNYEKSSLESAKGSDSHNPNPFDDTDNETGSSPKLNLIETNTGHLKPDSLATVLIKRLAVVALLVCVFFGLFFMRNLNKYEEAPVSLSNTTTIGTDPTANQATYTFLMNKYFYRLLN